MDSVPRLAFPQALHQAAFRVVVPLGSVDLQALHREGLLALRQGDHLNPLDLLRVALQVSHQGGLRNLPDLHPVALLVDRPPNLGNPPSQATDHSKNLNTEPNKTSAERS